jgi:transporter family-2 protein
VPSSLQWLVIAVIGLGAGTSFVLQQVVNANLRRSLGSPLWAAFVSYLGGALIVALLLVVLRQPWISTRTAQASSWLSWTGGAFGVLYVLASIALVPRVGATTTVALIIAGQLLASIAFDHFGILGLARQPADPTRLLGALMLMVGVMLVRR